jgi:hypothetical protein
MNALNETRAARSAARTKHQEVTAALDRARHAHSAAAAEAARLATEETRWVERHSKKLTGWIAAGSHGAQPALACDAKAQAALASARAAATAAAQALAGFEVAERESRQTLAAAEAAAQNAVHVVLTNAGEDLANQILARDAETEVMRQRLLGLRELVSPTPLVRRAAPTPGDWVHTPIPDLLESQAQGAARSRAHTPLNRLDSAEVDPAAIAHWQERFDALLTGSDADSTSDAQAAA